MSLMGARLSSYPSSYPLRNCSILKEYLIQKETEGLH